MKQTCLTQPQWRSIASAAALAVLISACGGNKVETSSSSAVSISSKSSSSVVLSSIATSSSRSSSLSSSRSSVSSSASSTNHAHGDHCVDGYQPQATDAAMKAGPAEFTKSGQTDLTIQPEAIKWMEDHEWQEAHFSWHQVRRCGAGGGGGGGAINPCSFSAFKPEQNECAGPQDGYEFLVMHRHMIESLKQLWPNHSEQFDGWKKFPVKADYPTKLQQYVSNWNGSVVTNAALADRIDSMTKEEAIRQWPTEGAFGQWIQCQQSGLHGALHFNGYPQQNQDHSIANQRRNLDAYLFWKLHGWIDNVWEKYRIKTGLAPTEPKLQAEKVAQCREMDFWAEKIDPSLVVKPVEEVEIAEAGFFHEKVRPALQRAGCATCHGIGEEADLRLGYKITSATLVSRLVNTSAWGALGYKLIVPGDPDRSWLYLKASGASKTTDVTCAIAGSTACKNVMPPGGMPGLTAAELADLRKWILDGAPAPTKP